MFGRKRRSRPEVPPALNNDGRLNAIETRLERLELDAHQKQLEVLQALDKALHALRARTATRERRESPQNDEPAPDPTPVATPTAFLSQRFRRF